MSSAILTPNLGLIFDRPPIALPDGALSAGQSFRVKEGKIGNLNLGWTRFGTFTLGYNPPDGGDAITAEAVTLIDSFFDRDGAQTLIFGTPSFLFRYIDADTVAFLNARYETGTATTTSANAVVTGSGTSWLTEAKAGDLFRRGLSSDPTEVWNVIQSVDSDTQITLTAGYSGSTGSGAYSIIQTFTGDLDNRWETVTFLHEADGDEDWWIATNGVDDMVYWNGVDDQVASMGLSFKAFHITIFKNMLLCAAITDGGEFYPAQMRNSDVGNPDDFSSGLSEIFTVHSGGDEVNAMVPLGDTLAIYAERHIVMSDFVDDPLVFVFRTAVEGIGPLSGSLVADFGDSHTFIGPDSGYVFDGVTLSEHGAHVLRQVLRQRSPTKFLRAFAHFDEENGELLWVVPLASDSGDGPAVAWPEHYLEETTLGSGFVPFSHRTFPFTASGFYERQSQLTWDQIQDQWQDLNFRWNDIFFEAAFPFNLVGDVDGKIYTYGTAQTGEGTLLPSYVRAGRRPTGSGRERNLIARVYPFASKHSETTLKVRCRLFDNAQGSTLQTTDEQEFDCALPEEGHFVSPYRCARYWELEFATDGDAYELAGWDYDLKPGGAR